MSANRSTGRLAREERQRVAEESRIARASRTPAEQLERLDKTLGAGVGAVKERRRLHRQIENSTPGEELLQNIFSGKAEPKKGRQPKGKKAKSS